MNIIKTDPMEKVKFSYKIGSSFCYIFYGSNLEMRFVQMDRLQIRANQIILKHCDPRLSPFSSEFNDIQLVCGTI